MKKLVRRSSGESALSRGVTALHLAEVTDGFMNVIGATRYALYVFDYGAPVGFRLALKHPEQITAVITQMGTPMRKASAQA